MLSWAVAKIAKMSMTRPAVKVSHLQLLLRCVRLRATTHELMFSSRAVDSICMPTSLDGLTIERDGDSFALSGREWEGSITARSCYQAEDGAEYFYPSPFEASF